VGYLFVSMPACCRVGTRDARDHACIYADYKSRHVRDAYKVPDNGAPRQTRSIEPMKNQNTTTVSLSAPSVAPDFLNRLHQVDALDFARRLPAQSLHMLFTDPPYSSGGLHAGARAQSTTAKYIRGDTKTVYADFESDNMDRNPAVRESGGLDHIRQHRQLPPVDKADQQPGWFQCAIRR
jgi:hypothetical protein